MGTESDRPHRLVPDQWEDFGEPIEFAPFVLESLTWKEVGPWDADDKRWHVKGTSRRKPGPWSKEGTKVQPMTVLLSSLRGRGYTVQDKEQLRLLFRERIVEKLKLNSKSEDLPAEIRIQVPLADLP